MRMAMLPQFDQWVVSILVPGILQLLVMQLPKVICIGMG
jgi:hypothetical protein